MTATTETIPKLTVPEPPFALGDVVYWTNPIFVNQQGRPFIITGITYRFGWPATYGRVWNWHVDMVPADNPSSFPFSPFDTDDLSRDPWTGESE